MVPYYRSYQHFVIVNYDKTLIHFSPRRNQVVLGGEPHIPISASGCTQALCHVRFIMAALRYEVGVPDCTSNLSVQHRRIRNFMGCRFVYLLIVHMRDLIRTNGINADVNRVPWGNIVLSGFNRLFQRPGISNRNGRCLRQMMHHEEHGRR